MRRRLLALMLALLALPAAGLATAVTSIPTTMNIALVSDPTLELYPLQMADRDMLSVMDLVYESPFVLDDDRRPTPSLVSDWSVSSDGRTWTFTFREDIYFHDGNEFTAYDVAATMDAIRYIASDTSLADNQKGLYSKFPDVWKSWTANDKTTLTVQAARPFYGMLYTMTFPVLQAQSVLSANPPGTGPYRVMLYTPGKELWLAGNERWYGPAPYISELICTFYATDDAALLAYESEQVDIVMTRSLSSTRYRGSATTRSNAYDYSTRQLECLMINNRATYIKDKDIRKAISYAIQKNRLITNVYQNMVTTTETIQHPASWLYPDESWFSTGGGGVTPYTYRPEEANAILDGLGWNNYNSEGHRFRKKENGEDEVLVLRLCYYDEAGNSARKEAANEIATMLRNVGFRVRMYSYSFEEAVAKLKSGDYDLFLCAYNFDVVPDPSFIFLSNGYGNYARYTNEKLTTLMQNIRAADEPDDFAGYWEDLQAMVHDDIAFIPLYWRNGVLLSRYPFSSVRDIREFELLKSINFYQ